MEKITKEAVEEKLNKVKDSPDKPRLTSNEINYPTIKNSASAIDKLIQKFPKHEVLDEIYLKVTAINSLFSTNIYDTYKIAFHIYNRVNDIDKRLDEGDKTVINNIASGHGIISKGKEKCFYSFATKYCSFHNPEKYAIYDTLIQNLLIKYYNSEIIKSKKDKINYETLRNYERFMEVIIEFKKYYNLQSFGLREIDMYLWLMGKEIELKIK